MGPGHSSLSVWVNISTGHFTEVDLSHFSAFLFHYAALVLGQSDICKKHLT